MNAQIKAFNQIAARREPTHTKEKGYVFDDCQDIIKKIETLIPANELEKVSFLQGKEACFNKFLDICFQHSIYIYGWGFAGDGFEKYTSMMSNGDIWAELNTKDGDLVFEKGKERAKVYLQYLELVQSDPYHDWMGDIFMEMVAQHVKNKYNTNAFYPTPYDMAALCAKLHISKAKEDYDELPIINICEICCGTAGMSMQNLKGMKENGHLDKVFLRLTDLDPRMTKIAATQCLTLMMVERIPFALQVINQNDITEEVYDVAFSNVGLAVHKTHSLKEETPWTPPNRSSTPKKPTASMTL